MTVRELIKELEKMPQDVNVNIFDWRKNLHDDWGDGSSDGIYSNFDIHYYELSEDEAKYYKDIHGVDFTPWVSIEFENSDYDDEGKCLLDEE